MIQALPHPTTKAEKLVAVIQGLADKSLYQTGGLVRRAEPKGVRGQIFAHLYQTGAAQDAASVDWGPALSATKELQHGMKLVQGLTMATTALSAINLGVSVAGFAILAKKMNQLQRGIRDLDEQVRGGFAHVDERLDRLENKVNGIALLLSETHDGVEWLKAGVHTLSRRIDWTKLSTLYASVESLSEIERGRSDGLSAAEHAERIRDVRVYLIGVLGESDWPTAEVIQPSLLHRRLLVLALAQAIAAEAYAWRMADETGVAVSVLQRNALELQQLTQRTCTELVGGDVALLGETSLLEEVSTRVDFSVPTQLLGKPWASPNEIRVELAARWTEFFAASPKRSRALLADHDRTRERVRAGRSLSFALTEAAATLDGLTTEYESLERAKVSYRDWERAQAHTAEPALYVRDGLTTEASDD